MSFRKTGNAGRIIAILASCAAATAAIAQTVADNELPQTGLNIPANLQIFGTRDPNVRKPTAIVNQWVITGTDVDQRVALVLAGNPTKLSDAELDQLRRQVLSSMIDETLQIQEAKARDITITTDEIDQSFARVAQNFKRSVADMRAYLRSAGSSDRSLRRQIEAELAWSRYLRRRIEPLVNVADEEVASIIKRLEASKGTEEYHVKEIYLAATPERQQQVFAEMRGYFDQIRQGKAQFEQIAFEHSEATTRAKAGDLGWVQASALPETLAQAAASMNINEIIGPIETPGGFSLLYLVDKRQILTADARDARLSLRQITLTFPKGATQADAAAKVAEFSKLTQSIHGCGDVAKSAASIGADVVDNDSTRIRDLPPQLQEIMLKLQIGESTQPFGSIEDGVRSLVLCGRDEVQENFAPSIEQMRGQMEQQAVNLRAEHKLRDLRRDAIVEYR
ncbi:MAG: peptidylprolyl isomerase [Sphingomonas sp.]|jgi:peptidyl-prolyl cis-trans isomerase SurA